MPSRVGAMTVSSTLMAFTSEAVGRISTDEVPRCTAMYVRDFVASSAPNGSSVWPS